MGSAASRWRSAIPSGVTLLMGALLGLACESARVQEPAAREESATAPVATLPLDQLSALRAWGDLEALTALLAEGASADPGAGARDYVASQLRPAGVGVEMLETPDAAAGPEAASWTHVVATVPGASPDWFLLVAPLGEADAAPAEVSNAVDEDASGAALLIELARVLSTRSLPYTTRLVWLSGERRAAVTDDLGAAGAASDLLGSRALAAHMSARGELSRIRLLVAFDRVCREDLRVARDLGSHRVHREEFFDAAARIGRTRTFSRNQGFESVEASHLAFRAAGVRAVAAIVGSSSEDAAEAQGARPRCSAESLDAVGAVTLDALDAIGRRLAKIDRFSRAPLTVP